MVDEAVKAGQRSEAAGDAPRGWVVEVDHSLLVARVELNQGGEKWERLDALEVVEPWDNRRRTA